LGAYLVARVVSHANLYLCQFLFHGAGCPLWIMDSANIDAA
jgi:hypothetical protein